MVYNIIVILLYDALAAKSNLVEINKGLITISKQDKRPHVERGSLNTNIHNS